MFILIQATKNFMLLTCGFFFFLANGFSSVKTWTGSAGDGNWATALNWSGGTTPNSSDDVLLDNSIKTGSYSISLPISAVIVKTVTISPSINNTIELVLPASNMQAPAFTATGPGYGLLINTGGIFRNSSGAPSSTTVDISDSIRINNGGKYIHNTQRSHASNIAVLSKMPGTETGIFEFNVPGTQSYTVSITNRTYGTLVFNANASPGGVRTYLGSGSNPLNIRGDLQIGIGVTLKIDLATEKGNINLNGDLIQSGGLLDLASGPDSTILKIKGNLIQSSGSMITESSTGLPVIELNGSTPQSISMHGTISNSIIFRMNDAAGAVLQSPLSLPYKLELIKGNITTTSNNLLTLQSGCSISVDSTIANKSFINGPLRKQGLFAAEYFLLPVGKPNEYRWLELKNATGNFNVEFISGDAKGLSTSYGAGVDHISSHGYWVVEPDASPSASAKLELSFADASGSGVTDMATLRASQLSSGIWVDRNNTFTTGTAGASGSVLSENITVFSSNAKQFVLASSVPNQNPLPVILNSFTATKDVGVIKLNWDVVSSDDIDYFEIWSAAENNNFEKLDSVPATSTETRYQFNDKGIANDIRYYKLRVVQRSGGSFFSKVISIRDANNVFKILSIAPSAIYNSATVFVYSKERAQLQFIITAMDGKIVAKKFFNAEKGRNSITCDFSILASGAYFLSCFDSRGNASVVRFVKL